MADIDTRESLDHQPAAEPVTQPAKPAAVAFGPPTAVAVGDRKLETPYDGTSEFHGPTAPLFAAMAKAQGMFPPIPRTRLVTIPTKNGGTYKYLYAPLEDVIDACRDALAANGLAFIEKILELKDGRLLLAYLTHESGSYMEGRILLGRIADPKDFGAATTYARRYQRQCMLGVSPEDDTDGEVEEVATPRQAPPRQAPPQRPMPPRPPNQPTRDDSRGRDDGYGGRGPDADLDAMIGPTAAEEDAAAEKALEEAARVVDCRRALGEYIAAAKAAKDIDELKKRNEMMKPWAADEDPTVKKMIDEATRFYQARYRELKPR